MNFHEVGELRHRFGLEGCAKREKTARVLACMNALLSDHRSEEEVAEVVSTSPRSWYRFKHAFVKARGLRPGEPLTSGPLDGGMSEVSGAPSHWEQLLMDTHAEQSASVVRSLQYPGHGWSFVSQARRRQMRRELGNVFGADLGDPVANFWHLEFKRRREINRQAALREAAK